MYPDLLTADGKMQNKGWLFRFFLVPLQRNFIF